MKTVRTRNPQTDFGHNRDTGNAVGTWFLFVAGVLVLYLVF